MNATRRGFNEGPPSNSSPESDYDIGELGPPLDYDDHELTPSSEPAHHVPHESGRSEYFDEFRSTPEYLNGQPYRRRCRTHLVLQQINGRPILLSGQRYKTAQELSSDSLFAQQMEGDPTWTDRLFCQTGDVSERFYHPEVGKQGGLHWTSHSRELTFLVHHLPPEVQTELADVYARGEKINFHLLWGPRWKLTRFGDQTKAYEWPRDDRVDDPKDFRGSNFVAFTKVGLSHDASGELVVSEALLAEANLYTKVGSTRINPKGGPRDGIFLDRSLRGLRRRADEGDIYLSEAERLYNQAADLHEGELSKSDEQWIRNAWIDFLSDKVDIHGYSVKGTYSMHFRLDEKGNVITDGDELKQEVRFTPIRVNVKKDGYLDGVLRRMGDQSHALNRTYKYTRFRDEIYPVFQTAVEQILAREALHQAQAEAAHPDRSTKPRWQADPHQALAHQLTRTEAMLKRFAARSPRNLAYLLHVFCHDAAFDSYSEPDLGRATRVLEAMRQINQDRVGTSLYQPHFTNEHVQACLDRLETMDRPGWLPQETRSGLVLPVSVDEPTRGANHRRINYEANGNNGSAGPLFKQSRNGKQSKLARVRLLPETRDNLIGFDVYPAKMTVAEVRAQLAEYGVDIIRTLAAEGDRPAIYALYMDPRPRVMSNGNELSPAQWVNMLRRAYDAERYTNGRSSKRAIEAGFQATAELARERAKFDPELTSILEYFDYQARLEATKESKAYSGAAGEVFTRIALNADLATMLGITELPEAIDYQITYIDRDRIRSKGKLGPYERDQLNRYVAEINAENPDSEHAIRPDFVVHLTDHQTNEAAELWFDSKAYIKKITPVAIQNLYDHYQPALNQHRRLVVVAHSPLRRITPAAREVAHQLGVIIVGSDAVAAALAKANPEQLNNQCMGNLVDEYLQYKEHPSAYAEDLTKRSGIDTYERLLDLQHLQHGPLFADTANQPNDREQLIYAK